MSILRRLFGGDRNGQAKGPPTPAPVLDGPASTAGDDDERAREAELARFDQDRADDLIQRQQRYADRSWTPPRQGGELRAEDNDRSE